MDLTRLLRCGIKRKHPHPTAKTHPHMEKLHVELPPFNIVPQRVVGVILDAVIRLRRQGRQGIRQRPRRTAPRRFSQIAGHALQHGKIEATALTIGDIGICSKRRTREERSKAGGPARCGQRH